MSKPERALLTWLTVAFLNVGVAAAGPPNLAREGAVSASSSASAFDADYGPPKAVDGDFRTRWASADGYALPQWFEVRWNDPRTVDGAFVAIYTQPDLYDAWREWEISFSKGEPERGEMTPGQTELLARFPPRRTTFVRLSVRSTHSRTHYLGIKELMLVSDPKHKWSGPPRPPRPLARGDLPPQGRAEHPTVYLTAADVARAKRNAAGHEWARKVHDGILAEAERWLDRREAEWLAFLPEPGACYAYGFTGCPICGAPWGTWGRARCSWENPGHVTCSNGHLLPDDAHPDDGAGYRGEDGRVHYFVGSWNAWATEQWTLNAIPSLARAYALTGDDRYADRAAFFLDALASVYSESTAGSWDYPSSPPSGRLARPWYQVARNLVVYVEAYDLIYGSSVLDRASLRPSLEKGFPPGPPPQTREVRTKEAHGQSWAAMTRRENIDVNLIQDGAYYCYAHTFDGRLHNGHADYMRGAMAVGCLLGIPEYVRWATEGPFSIYAMLDNNVDRDGRYYETSLPYSHHTRSLYLTFSEPLANWRDEQHPQGIDLYSAPRFRRFYALPDLVMECAGHTPNFGDASPDNRFALPDEARFSNTDYALAERMYSGSRRAQDKALFGAVLQYLSDGDVDRLRAGSNMGAWLLFHADDLPADAVDLPAELRKRLDSSWFLGQKGIGMLRAGDGERAQAALLRWGPTLNHGDYDELGLLYYGGGWQLTYDIGYGLGSTHTHIGWANQTASHNAVVVNETSQLKAPGSGGSLHLFVTAPGLQAIEASDENAYASEDVSTYRRTVALIGGAATEGASREPADPAYVVDVFRVVGGRQHDYFLGVQSQELEVDGVSLGSAEPGSLAGPDISWGTSIGNDGDVIGYPNKPYWNPPPGNGYGFFYDVRRGTPEGAWRVTWPLGGPLDTGFRAHFLPPTDSEAVVAKAPGLYPKRGYGVAHSKNASYGVVRRAGVEPLASTFVTVMEPYCRRAPSGLIPAAELEKRLAEATAEVKPLANLRVFLLKGAKPGDRMTFQLDISADDEYTVAVNVLRAPVYGTARFLLDEELIGEPVDAWAPAIEGPELRALGRRQLSAGAHSLTVEMTELRGQQNQYYIGLAGVLLAPAGEGVSFEARPFIRSVERVHCTSGSDGGLEPVGVKIALADGHVDYLLSGGMPDERVAYQTDSGEIEVGGALAYLRLTPDGKVARAVLHGADWLRFGDWHIAAPARAHEGIVAAVDEEAGVIQTSAQLPADAAFNGCMVYFANDGYSRNTTYEIQRVEAAGDGSVIRLGQTSLILGRGLVFDVTDDGTALSSIPHEYACPIGGSRNSRVFDGKLVTNGRGGATHLTAVEFGSPMKLEMESTAGFAPGDTLFYHDIQPGDSFVLPTTTVFTRGEVGR
ncbi:MAG: heparinase II/III family protein [Armatimonadota bacterium]|nr:MAG: heparinase II/III family protein [Armatimonadota bacterium]